MLHAYFDGADFCYRIAHRPGYTPGIPVDASLGRGWVDAMLPDLAAITDRAIWVSRRWKGLCGPFRYEVPLRNGAVALRELWGLSFAPQGRLMLAVRHRGVWVPLLLLLDTVPAL